MRRPRNKPDALHAAQSRFPGIRFSGWEQAHPDVRAAFLRELVKLGEAFPPVAARLREVSVVSASGFPDEDLDGYAYPDGSAIVVNVRWARDSDSDGRWLCRHEFGHQKIHCLEADARTAEEFRRWRRGRSDHRILEHWDDRGRTAPKMRELLARLT